MSRDIRTGAVVALASFVLVACGAEGEPESDESSSPSASPVGSPSVAVDPLVGVWAWEESCQDLVTTLKEAGLSEFTGDWLVGLGFHRGPASQVADDPTPCSDATEALHRTTEFTDSGGFIETMNGETVCDCTYDPSGQGMFVIHGDPGDPDVTVHYRADETSVSFEVELPQPCTSATCRSQKAWAFQTFMLDNWERSSV